MVAESRLCQPRAGSKLVPPTKIAGACKLAPPSKLAVPTSRLAPPKTVTSTVQVTSVTSSVTVVSQPRAPSKLAAPTAGKTVAGQQPRVVKSSTYKAPGAVAQKPLTAFGSRVPTTKAPAKQPVTAFGSRVASTTSKLAVPATKAPSRLAQPGSRLQQPAARAPVVAKAPAVGKGPAVGKAPVVGRAPAVGRAPVVGKAPVCGRAPVGRGLQQPTKVGVGLRQPAGAATQKPVAVRSKTPVKVASPPVCEDLGEESFGDLADISDVSIGELKDMLNNLSDFLEEAAEAVENFSLTTLDEAAEDLYNEEQKDVEESLSSSESGSSSSSSSTSDDTSRCLDTAISTPSCCDDLLCDLEDYDGPCNKNDELKVIRTNKKCSTPTGQGKSTSRRDILCSPIQQPQKPVPVKLTVDQIKKAMTGDLVVKLVVDSKLYGPLPISTINLAEELKPEDYKFMVETNQVPEIFKEVFGPDWDGELPKRAVDIQKTNKDLLSKALEKAGPVATVLEEYDAINLDDLNLPDDDDLAEISLSELQPPEDLECVSPDEEQQPCPLPKRKTPRQEVIPEDEEDVEAEEEDQEYTGLKIPPQNFAYDKGNEDLEQLFVESCQGMFKDLKPFVIQKKPDPKISLGGGQVKLTDLYEQGYTPPVIPKHKAWRKPPDTPPRTPTPPPSPASPPSPATPVIINPLEQDICGGDVLDMPIQPIGDWIAKNGGQVPDTLALVIPGPTADQTQKVNYNLNTDGTQQYDPNKPVDAKEAIGEILTLSPVIDKLVKLQNDNEQNIENILNEFSPSKMKPTQRAVDKRDTILGLVPLTPAFTDIIGIIEAQKQKYNNLCNLQHPIVPQKVTEEDRLKAKQLSFDVGMDEDAPKLKPKPKLKQRVQPKLKPIPESKSVSKSVCEPEPVCEEPVCEEPVCEEPVCEDEPCEPVCEEEAEEEEEEIPLPKPKTPPKKMVRGQIINEKKDYKQVVSKVTQRLRDEEEAKKAAGAEGKSVAGRGKIVNEKIKKFGDIKSKVDYAVPDSVAVGPVKKAPGRGTIVNEKMKKFAIKSKVVSKLDDEIEGVRVEKAKKSIVNIKASYNTIKSKVSSNVPDKTAAARKTAEEDVEIVPIRALADPDEPDPESKYDIDYTKGWETEAFRLTQEARKKIKSTADTYFKAQEADRIAQEKKDEEARIARGEAALLKERSLLPPKIMDKYANVGLDKKREIVCELLKAMDNQLAFEIELKYMHGECTDAAASLIKGAVGNQKKLVEKAKAPPAEPPKRVPIRSQVPFQAREK